MNSVKIIQPIENSNSVCFKVENATHEEKRYYIQEMNVQSFLRNIDWSTNCFSWIEARKLIEPSKYYVVDDNESTSSDLVYVLCCLRISPGTYSNVESVLDNINEALKRTIELPEKIEGTPDQITERDLPCALHDIEPKYDPIAGYKITGFEVGMFPDLSNYSNTQDGYVPESKIAPAILDMDLFPVRTGATNATPTVTVATSRAPPVIYYDLINGTYSLDYPGSETKIAEYIASVATLNDKEDALNKHSIDFNSSVTNHLGLTPYRLPMDTLFSINGEPIIIYDNGNDYMEYLIDPTKLDISELSKYYINTIGSAAAAGTRSTKKSPSWIASFVNKSVTNKDEEDKWLLSRSGLAFNITDPDNYADVHQRIIINNELCPEYLTLRNYQLITDVAGKDDTELYNTVSTLLTNIVSRETQLKRINEDPEKDIVYTVQSKQRGMTLALTVAFTGDTKYLKTGVTVDLSLTNDNGEEIPVDRFLTGVSFGGVYDSIHYLNTVSTINPLGELDVIQRLNATVTIPVLAIYNNLAWLTDTLDDGVEIDSKVIDLNRMNITETAVKRERLTVDSNNIGDDQFKYTVNTTMTTNDPGTYTYIYTTNATMDYAFTFSSAVLFELNSSNYDSTKDTIPRINKTLAKCGFVQRRNACDTRVYWRKTTGTYVIAPHKHVFEAFLRGVTVTFRHSLELVPLNRMIAVYDPFTKEGCRYYRAFDVRLYEYKVPDDKYIYHAKYEVTTYRPTPYRYSANVESGEDVGKWDADCSHIGCSEDTDMRTDWEDFEKEATIEYNKAKVDLASKGTLYTYTIYLAYKRDANGNFVCVYTGDSVETAKLHIPYNEFINLMNDIEENVYNTFTTPKERKAEQDAIKNGLAGVFEVIYPLGPYIDPRKIMEIAPDIDLGNMPSEDMINIDDTLRTYAELHNMSWYDEFEGKAAAISLDESTGTTPSLRSIYTNRGMDSTTSIPMITAADIKGVPLIELENNHNLRIITGVDDSGNYIVILSNVPITDDNYIRILPVNKLFAKPCKYGNSALVIHSTQAWAYTSITNYDPFTDSTAAKERALITRDRESTVLAPGSVMIDGSVYLMDKNNIFADSVNKVKYYPFFPFSNKLYVYAIPDENVDQTVESQLPSLRTVRSSLAEITIPTVYKTTTTVQTDSSTIRFTNNTGGEALAPFNFISYEQSDKESRNEFAFNIQDSGVTLKPVDGTNKEQPLDLNSVSIRYAASKPINIDTTIDQLVLPKDDSGTTEGEGDGSGDGTGGNETPGEGEDGTNMVADETTPGDNPEGGEGEVGEGGEGDGSGTVNGVVDNPTPFITGKIILNELTLSRLNGTMNMKADKSNGKSSSITADVDVAALLTNTLISGTISSLEEILSGLVTGTIASSIITSTITNGKLSGDISGNISDTQGGDANSYISAVINDGAISGSVVGTIPGTNIHNTITLTDGADVSSFSGMFVQKSGSASSPLDIGISDMDMNYLITGTAFTPLPEPTLLDPEAGTEETIDEDIPMNEYGRGTIELTAINMDINTTIAQSQIEKISGSFTPPYYQNSGSISVRGTQSTPIEVDLSNVVGVLANDDIKVTEKHRLNYEVEISPYNIPINKTITVPPKSSKYIYITGNLHRYPIWESTHTLIYKIV